MLQFISIIQARGGHVTLSKCGMQVGTFEMENNEEGYVCGGLSDAVSGLVSLYAAIQAGIFQHMFTMKLNVAGPRCIA